MICGFVAQLLARIFRAFQASKVVKMAIFLDASLILPANILQQLERMDLRLKTKKALQRRLVYLAQSVRKELCLSEMAGTASSMGVQIILNAKIL